MRTDGRSGRGKTADAGRWSLFARSGNGFLFEAGADEDTHFRATSPETLRNMVAAGSGITLLPALAVPPERKRDGVVYLPCIKPEPRRTIGWFIVWLTAAQPL